jgi:hypothetical protein
MTQTRWTVDSPDETGLELEGRWFSSNDEGGPMMCNLVCSSMGRHIHFDYCRTEENTPCEGAEFQHVDTRMIPYPHKPKDAVTHSLYWRRTGTMVIYLTLFCSGLKFVCRIQRSLRPLHYLKALTEIITIITVDPYTRDEQFNFTKWCVMLCR